MLTLARGPEEPREEDSRENEAVTVQPVWVLWVELHELAVEDVGHGCHAPALRPLSAWFTAFFKCAHNPAILNTWVERRIAVRQMGENNVHRRTRVARVGMGGRISLERKMVSTIDHIEAWLLRVSMVKQLSTAAAATAMEGQSWPLPHAVEGMLGLDLDLRPGPGWC